jgi:hypothetical protein
MTDLSRWQARDWSPDLLCVCDDHLGRHAECRARRGYGGAHLRASCPALACDQSLATSRGSSLCSAVVLSSRREHPPPRAASGIGRERQPDQECRNGDEAEAIRIGRCRSLTLASTRRRAPSPLAADAPVRGEARVRYRASETQMRSSRRAGSRGRSWRRPTNWQPSVRWPAAWRCGGVVDRIEMAASRLVLAAGRIPASNRGRPGSRARQGRVVAMLVVEREQELSYFPLSARLFSGHVTRAVMRMRAVDVVARLSG